MCSVFLGKNWIWLGNPVYPGFQSVFAKPERLAQTATFNTFQINKETQKEEFSLGHQVFEFEGDQVTVHNFVDEPKVAIIDGNTLQAKRICTL